MTDARNPQEEIIAKVDLPPTWDCRKIKLSLSKTKRLKLKRGDMLFNNIERKLESMRKMNNHSHFFESHNACEIVKISQYMNLKNAIQFEMLAKAYTGERGMYVENWVEYLWYPLHHREMASTFIQDGFNFKLFSYPKKSIPNSQFVSLGKVPHLLRNPFEYLPLEVLDKKDLYVTFLLCRCLVGDLYRALPSQMSDANFHKQKTPPIIQDALGNKKEYNSVTDSSRTIVAIFQENHILPEFVVTVRIAANNMMGQAHKLQDAVWGATEPLLTANLITGQTEEVNGSAKILMRSIPDPAELQKENSNMIPLPSNHVEPESRFPSDDILMDPTLRRFMVNPVDDARHAVHIGMNRLLPLKSNRDRIKTFLNDAGWGVQRPGNPPVQPMFHPDQISSDQLNELFMRSTNPNYHVESYATHFQKFIDLTCDFKSRIPDAERIYSIPPLTYDEKLRMMQLLAIIQNEVRSDMSEAEKRVYYQFVKHTYVKSYIAKIERKMSEDTGDDRNKFKDSIQAFLVNDTGVWNARHFVCDLLPGFPNDRLLIIPIMGNFGLLFEDLGFKLKEPQPVVPHDVPQIMPSQTLANAGPAKTKKKKVDTMDVLTGPIPTGRGDIKQFADAYNSVILSEVKLLSFENDISDFLPPLMTKTERENIIQFISTCKQNFPQAAHQNTAQYLLFRDSVWTDFETRYRNLCNANAPTSRQFLSFEYPRLIEINPFDDDTYRKNYVHGSKRNMKIVYASHFARKRVDRNSRRYTIRLSKYYYIDFKDAGFQGLRKFIETEAQFKHKFHEEDGGIEFLDDVMTGSLAGTTIHISVIKKYLNSEWKMPADPSRQNLRIVALAMKYEKMHHLGLDEVPVGLYTVPTNGVIYKYITPDCTHALEIPLDLIGGVSIPDP